MALREKMAGQVQAHSAYQKKKSKAGKMFGGFKRTAKGSKRSAEC